MDPSDASFKTLVFLRSKYFIFLEDGKIISPYVMVHVDFSEMAFLCHFKGTGEV